MTIKQQGGIFGRNPTFNDVDVEGALTVNGSQEIKVTDVTAYDASAADAQVTVGPSLFLNNPSNSNDTVGGQVVFGLRSATNYARIGATGGTARSIFVGVGTSEVARFTSDGLTFNGDTAAANAISDYEEGSWSPVISDASTGGNLSSASISDASYTKIGRTVVLSAQLTNIDTTGMTASNILHIRGLPFVSSSGNFSVGSVKSDNLTFQGGRTNIYCHLQRSDDWLAFQVTGSAISETYIDVGDVVSGTTDISFSITYIT